MKVVIVAPVHIYDDVRVFRKEAVTLAAAGHEVILYARTPDGRPLTRDGVTVRPVSYRNRLHRFAQLPLVGHRAWREGADVYHVHNPDTIPIAAALKARRKRVIYDTHEDFRTEILLRQWLPAIVRRPAAAVVAGMESAVSRVVDAVIVTQEQLLERLPGAVVIGNPPIVDRAAGLAAAARREARSRRPGRSLVLGYVGGVSKDRGLLRMVDLVVALQRHLPTRLLLVGPAVNDDALERAQEHPGWTHVDYRGELAQEDAFAALADADLGMILFEDTASHRHIDPNKIYEYLALALPVVATDFAIWRQRFADTVVGLFVPASAATEGVAQQVADFVADRPALAEIGRTGADFVWQQYSWQKQGAPLLLAVYDRVVGGG
jgi:glycosyltransferase involved in cell wall biosynthesis